MEDSLSDFIMPDEDTIPDDDPQVKNPMEDSMADLLWPDADGIHGDNLHLDLLMSAKVSPVRC